MSENHAQSDQQRVKLTKAEKKARYRTDFKEPIKSRREWLKRVMNEEDREQQVRSAYFKFFHEDRLNEINMYERAVETIKAMPDRGKTCGQVLTEWYLQDFKTWLTESGGEESMRREFLNAQIQSEALACSADQHKKLISDVFQISSEKLKEDIKALLQSHIAKKDFVSAAQLAIQHNLSKKYEFEELALPLVLSGKESIAYQLIVGDSHLQAKLVKFLDKFVDISQFEAEEKLKQYKDQGITNISVERYTGKPIDRLIKSIIERPDFDKDLIKYAPRHETNGHVKAIKYYILERYDKKGDDDQYFQHMQCLSKSSGKVRENILFYLWDSKSYQKQIDAISWAIFLEINNPTSMEVPGLMRDFFRNPDDRLQDARKLLEERKERSIPLPTTEMYVYDKPPRYRIHMVETEEALTNLCSQLKHLESDEDPVYLGFDSEWKQAHMTEPNTMKIAIIQLFFRETVWLVDCVQLEKLEIKVQDETWQKFAKRLLRSEKIKVIGFDLRNDLDAILTIPALKHTLKIEDIRNAWCVKRLTENVCDIDMSILGLEKKTFKLADLTQKLLGIELDKTEQCSNWAGRPLRTKQIVYAAMDAVVVVETFKKVLDMAKDASEVIIIKKLWEESNVMAPKKEKDRITSRKFHTIPWVELYEALNSRRDPSKPQQKPFNLEVIVDTMLLGFGKNLRRIGVDVLIPRDIADFREKLKTMARLGGALQRHILTIPSKSYEALRVEYGRHTIALEDLTAKSSQEQVASFLDRFNIELSPKLDFFRCTECNSRHIVKFPAPVVHFLHQYRVLYQQNAYRSMNEFPLEDWWHRMHHINPSDYDDIQVEMSRPSPSSNWIVATVPTGCLHVTRNTVLHNNVPCGVEVRIHKVPDDEFKRHGLCFFICGDCGTVHYDGRAQYASHGPINNNLY